MCLWPLACGADRRLHGSGWHLSLTRHTHTPHPPADAQIVGRPPAELIADYEERLGPAPDAVRAFFHALAE